MDKEGTKAYSLALKKIWGRPCILSLVQQIHFWELLQIGVMQKSQVLSQWWCPYCATGRSYMNGCTFLTQPMFHVHSTFIRSQSHSLQFCQWSTACVSPRHMQYFTCIWHKNFICNILLIKDTSGSFRWFPHCWKKGLHVNLKPNDNSYLNFDVCVHKTSITGDMILAS